MFFRQCAASIPDSHVCLVSVIEKFEFKCIRCGKGFRHKENLSNHMTCHTRTANLALNDCRCVYPCIPVQDPVAGPPEVPRAEAPVAATPAEAPEVGHGEAPVETASEAEEAAPSRLVDNLQQEQEVSVDHSQVQESNPHSWTPCIS